MTTTEGPHGKAEDHHSRAGGADDHLWGADETGELKMASLAEMKQAAGFVIFSVAITRQTESSRVTTAVVTGQAGSSRATAVVITRQTEY